MDTGEDEGHRKKDHPGLPRMEKEGKIIAEAVGRIVEEKSKKMAKEKKVVERRKEERIEELEEKVRKMVKEKKEVDKKKEERIEGLEEKVRRMEKMIERMEQNRGKRKREDIEESVGVKKKWWAGVGERNENELRKRNVILRVEKEVWGDKGSHWEKVKEIFTEGLKIRVTVRDVFVVGQRGAWLTLLVKLKDEEEKWRVIEARRKAGNRVGVKIVEDKSVERRDRERERGERGENGRENKQEYREI
ncbi:uncharacterized protein [Temnothorax nylanderi]|uniref:uncharacterized protein n=1 Tax=Temnothorax nylanderi TaxID=102681 RepID=UPI003A84EEDB